jgi:hypothetical protein
LICVLAVAVLDKGTPVKLGLFKFAFKFKPAVIASEFDFSAKPLLTSAIIASVLAFSAKPALLTSAIIASVLAFSAKPAHYFCCNCICIILFCCSI